MSSTSMTTSTTTSTSKVSHQHALVNRLEIPGWADCKYSNRNIQACLVHAFPFLAPGATDVSASTGKCLHCWFLLTSMEYTILSVIFVLNSLGVAVNAIKYILELVFTCDK